MQVNSDLLQVKCCVNCTLIDRVLERILQGQYRSLRHISVVLYFFYGSAILQIHAVSFNFKRGYRTPKAGREIGRVFLRTRVLNTHL